MKHKDHRSAIHLNRRRDVLRFGDMGADAHDRISANTGKFGPFTSVETDALGDLVVFDDEKRVAFGCDGRLKIELDADMGGDVIREIRKLEI